MTKQTDQWWQGAHDAYRDRSHHQMKSHEELAEKTGAYRRGYRTGCIAWDFPGGKAAKRMREGNPE